MAASSRPIKLLFAQDRRFLAPLFHGGYFPSFNIADAAITAGAVGLILDELLRVRRSR
jgi:signal peptidase II